MNQKTLLYVGGAVAVVVVLYFLLKGSQSTSSTSTINRLVPLQGENNSQLVGQVDSSAKAAMFSDLSRLVSENLQLEGLKTTLLSGQETERIRAGIQKELGMQNLEAVRLQVDGTVEAQRVVSADRRYDTDMQLVAQDRILQAQKDVYATQANSQYQSLLAQIGAVQSVGSQYRNQSLERQGTILNALTSLWGQTPYNYVDAFGGNRPPTFLQQLSSAINSGARAFQPFF